MSSTSEELRLSVSKTKTFIDCKKKFKFSYIEKLPKKDWDHHIFGKFCHKVLEDFHNAYIKFNSTKPFNVEMGQAFKNAVKEFGDKMTAEMKKDCWVIIDKYLRIVTNDKKNNLSANVVACEKNFDFSIGENVILNGMIDRVQIDADNVVHVCDYKTVKNKKYLKDDFFQLLTYAYVMVLENPDLEKVRASYILLRHDFEYITTEFSVPEIMKIRDKYLDYANQIVSEKIYVANPTALCNFCDFLNLCPEGKTKSYNQNIYGEVNW
jgi:CRISPR/Cas system-associated exonuclease Cas4 (RecB family)